MKRRGERTEAANDNASDSKEKEFLDCLCESPDGTADDEDGYDDTIDSGSGFPDTETHFVEGWIAGWVPRDQLEERLRDWAYGTSLECGHRVLLLVFPRSPQAHHVLGFVRSACSPSELADDWKKEFGKLWKAFGSDIAFELEVGNPLDSNVLSQKVTDAFMSAMMTSVPEEKMGMAPFIIDLGDLRLRKSVLTTIGGGETRGVNPSENAG